jgi:hypothetical protein
MNLNATHLQPASMLRLLPVGLAALLSLALILAAPASAEMKRPHLYAIGIDGAVFDPENPKPFSNTGELALDQATDRLYVLNRGGGAANIGIWGYQISEPNLHTPLAAPFPLLVPNPGGGGTGIAVDNSGLGSAGRLYWTSQFSGLIRSWLPSGVEQGVPWPINPPQPRNLCSVGVDTLGNFAVGNQNSSAKLEGRTVLRYSSQGVELNPVGAQSHPGSACRVAFDSQDNLYMSGNQELWRYTKASNYTSGTPMREGNPQALEVNRANDHLFVSEGRNVEEYDPEGNLVGEFGDTVGVVDPNWAGVVVNEDNDRVYVSTTGTPDLVHVFGPPVLLADPTTGRPTKVSTTGATLRGHVELDGGPEVTECFFQYGTSLSYGSTAPCEPEVSQADPIEGPLDVTGTLLGLSEGTTYNYRLVVKTENGYNVGANDRVIAQNPPGIGGELVLEVTSDKAILQGTVNPRTVPSTYFYEYGTEDCAIAECEATEVRQLIPCPGLGSCPSPNEPVPAPTEIGGLEPDTKYYFRIVAENDQEGLTSGTTQTFKTFERDTLTVDPCPNANVRKQTKAGLLSHCRAYELVSAADAGGYDVLSNAVPGRIPLPAHPDADDRFLYTTTDGKLPGIAGFPVNLGTDPYVAERGSDGWSTRYAGLPATLPSATSFASTASSADAGLDAFAFAEDDRCDPCFGDGSRGIPVRLPNGQVIQGMKGSIPVASPESAGEVGKHLSDDGTHFVFGSEQQFEPQGNAGSVTIYDRNLAADETQVVSTMPDGSTMTGDVAQLDISEDGSRILIGKLVRTDERGHPHYDLYMHVGENPEAVLVADTPNGVLYNGMTADGTEVYFTTADVHAGDEDSSVDLFRANVGKLAATVERVSTGSEGTGQTDACTTPENWNMIEGEVDCSVLGIAGGNGIAPDSGEVYFISPERLRGPENGVDGQPNLYIARPGEAPEYVGLLDNSLIKPPPEPPRRPQITEQFNGFQIQQPTGLGIDQQTKSVFVTENSGGGRLARFDSTGAPQTFTQGPGEGSHRIPVPGVGGAAAAAVDVDRAPGSLFNGAIYVKSSATVRVYSEGGVLLGELTGFNSVCGLAIDQSTGNVYVGDSSYGGVRKFSPKSAATPVSKANYDETSIKTEGLQPCQVAVDTMGNLYAAQTNNGPVRRYSTGSFAVVPPSVPGTQVSPTGRSIDVDPVSNNLYVDDINEINVYFPDGKFLQSFGGGTLSNSSAVAVRGSDHHTFATSNNNRIRLYGYEEIPYREIEHPALEHAVEAPFTPNGEDLQVTPDGEHAVFTSRVGLADAPSEGFVHVFHHETTGNALSCTSCKPTGALGIGHAFLSPSGLNIADDGRVFFSSIEQLTLRDTNRRTDAYEWDDGELNLVSTGTGIVNATLASVDSSGKNVYFFTRESIAVQDENGPVMKIYTAREGGGYGYVPDSVPCQAADECRGAGTKVPPPPPIGTYRGEGGNLETDPVRRCRKGFVSRGGRCVRAKCRRGFVRRGNRCVSKRKLAKRKAQQRKRREARRSRGARRG